MMATETVNDRISDIDDAELWACVMELAPADGAMTPDGQPRHVHAAFLRWLETEDPTLTAELHRANAVRPFTIAILPGGTDGTLRLRCTFLRPRLYRAVQARLSRTPTATWRIGRTAYALAGASVASDQAGWTGQASFAGILGRATPAPDVCLEFTTPTAFSLGDARTMANGPGSAPTFGDGTAAMTGKDGHQLEGGRKRIELFPRPRLLWESWARKWNAFAPPYLALDTSAIAEAVQHVLVADYDLRTMTLDFGRFPQKGFTGWAHYDLRTLGEADQRRLHALAAFAFYGGTGYKTAQGLGLTRLRR